MSSEVGVESQGEPGFTLGELAAELGVPALELVGAMVEAGLVTVESYADALRPADGGDGVLLVRASQADVVAWARRWVQPCVAASEPGE